MYDQVRRCLSDGFHPLRIDLCPELFNLPYTFTESQEWKLLRHFGIEVCAAHIVEFAERRRSNPLQLEFVEDMASVSVHRSYGGLVDHPSILELNIGHLQLDTAVECQNVSVHFGNEIPVELCPNGYERKIFSKRALDRQALLHGLHMLLVQHCAVHFPVDCCEASQPRRE